eukprot:TRINITY_DN59897_c0_g1_i3.p2 TRINITY_DN59897_c0_g1~~TRINITY_DN59897_c0_g1_i3.p2  ORF type:complete len:190 (-),score=32.72 TRINITY_DN59897_c0_g1_i3:180-749(-)
MSKSSRFEVDDEGMHLGRPVKKRKTVSEVKSSSLCERSKEQVSAHAHVGCKESCGVLRKMMSTVNPNKRMDGSAVMSLDCEMVGVGSDGRQSVLARVCVVDGFGKLLLDTFVRPIEFVTDFRTRITGIRSKDLFGPSSNAITFSDAQKKCADLIQGKLLIGHSLHHDLGVLMISHPKGLTWSVNPMQHA